MCGMLLLFLFIMSLPAARPLPKQPFADAHGDRLARSEGPGRRWWRWRQQDARSCRKAELPGKEKITVPVAKPPKLQPTPPKEIPKPAEQLTIPAQTMATGVQELPGAISSLPTLPTRRRAPALAVALEPGRELESVRAAAPGSATAKAAAPAAASTVQATA